RHSASRIAGFSTIARECAPHGACGGRRSHVLSKGVKVLCAVAYRADIPTSPHRGAASGAESPPDRSTRRRSSVTQVGEIGRRRRPPPHCSPLAPPWADLQRRREVARFFGANRVDCGEKWGTVVTSGAKGSSVVGFVWRRALSGRWEPCFWAPTRPSSTTRGG